MAEIMNEPSGSKSRFLTPYHITRSHPFNVKKETLRQIRLTG
ncbi:Hypothetical protein, conserved [Brucella abortus str. 2308 A]|uniref:Uncharacterized protein n=1 Tax=Brucella suis (strain ATCC 23445 / NCTC 10510) TaxID=470137 RepID=B0CHL3_BRUSI|nr:Hypothetical protein, conserved [Brucella suis ATCC 23445]EEP63333.1 Hypothetical protein, conserved [Brucella abortus str. 2308 A]EEX82876.1 predicted protein [Brucella abortus bv. 3 str. Tulya]EEY26583.1 predicted protein [Brucella sp. F5/99]